MAQSGGDEPPHPGAPPSETAVSTRTPSTRPPADAVSANLDEETTRVSPVFGHSLPAGAGVLADFGDTPYGPTRLVGRYQVVERLGHGAMATVYKAYDPGIHRTLALKFLHPALCADAEYRERFLREARAAGALSHPNIVTVFDVGEVESRPYIAMEFLEGQPLSESLRAGKPLPLREVVAIGIQLARALDYAHAKGVVHRDIKPANIVRTGTGAATAIKVADFGIAHLDTAESADQTRAGTILGTPHYMSPEQALGQRSDARSDLFSAGVVLYQLATGKLPFNGENLVTLAQSIVKDEPPAVERIRGEVPAALRRIIARCLRKAPEKRFQTGAEMAMGLEALARDLDEQAAAVGASRVIPLRVKWTLIMAAVVAVTMLVTASIVVNRQHAALRDGILDYGSSMARFMATEHAEATLTEDWVALDVIVQELMKSRDFQSIAFVDRQGVVRASSDPQAVGKAYAPSSGSPLPSRAGDVRVRQEPGADGDGVLAFDAPIRFQDKEIGHVHLGLTEAPLYRVARLSVVLMVVLVVVTVAAVVIATWLIANRYSKPIRLLSESMAEIGKGRFDYRIAEKRDDEFGQLYRAFDSMAESLNARSELGQGPEYSRADGASSPARGRAPAQPTPSRKRP